VVKYPDSTKTSPQQRLSARARQRWPELTRVAVRHHGTFSLPGRHPARRHHPQTLPAALHRLRPPMALRDLPRQPRRLTNNRSSPPDYPSAPAKTPSTPPAASTWATPPPGH